MTGPTREHLPGPTRRRKYVGASRFAALIAVALACGAAACGSAGKPSGSAEAAAPAESIEVSDSDAAAAGIAVAPAERVERLDALRASGVVTFDERRTARVGAFVEGVVADVLVQPGDTVRAGTELATIHSHVVHDAWAGYFKALAAAEQAEAEFIYAQAAEERAAGLVADKALSPQELARARADVTAAGQILRAARAEVTRAEQELRHYGLTPDPAGGANEHDHVSVVAPFAGTVIERLVTQGAAVTPGTPLFLVSDLSRVWIDAEVDEVHLGALGVGGKASVEVDAYPGETFGGGVLVVGDVINPSTRRVKVRVEVPNADRRLKPQMFARVALAPGAARSAIVVPSRAVQTMDGESVVFVRHDDGTFTRQVVTIGPEVDGRVEVSSGLAEGTIVATAGAFLLKSELVGPPSGDDE
jgi:cobalt-zinc-cadmium efflux system membrane fusion protein